MVYSEATGIMSAHWWGRREGVVYSAIRHTHKWWQRNGVGKSALEAESRERAGLEDTLSSPRGQLRRMNQGLRLIRDKKEIALPIQDHLQGMTLCNLNVR